MIARQKLEFSILLLLALFTFASYSQGSVIWLQWLTAIVLLFFVFAFDVLFANESQFIYDPDAENWRRKTVRKSWTTSE